jgi:hypothetical protein
LIFDTVPEYSKSIRKQASQELAKAEGE